MKWFDVFSSPAMQGASGVQQKPPSSPAQKNSKVTIPLQEQKWVPQSIDTKDYTSMSGLRKRFPIGEYSLEKLPEDLVKSNGGAGMAYIGKEKVTLDEVTMFHSRTGGSYGSVGIKHTKDGDVVYVHENKDGFNIMSKYVNGQLQSVEKTSEKSSSQSGIMPWA